MKNCAFLVASAIVCASAAVFADNVQGDNVFGILPVTSGTEYTIVAVPWCECSTNNDQPIAVSNIVKTANLEANDMVYVLNSAGNYSAWKLTEGAGGVLYWDSVKEVTSTIFGDTVPATSATVARGSAIILYRQTPKDGSAAKTFYLFGQVGTNSTVTTTIEAGSSTIPAYTLIAPPGADAVNLIDKEHPDLTGCQNDDRIVLRSAAGINREHFYDSAEDEWKYVTCTYPGGKETVTTNIAESITLQPGFGAWYISRSTTAPTLTWKNVTHK